MSDVVYHAEDCVQVIEAALEVMDPPLDYDIHQAVLLLIAELAAPYGRE